MAELRRSSGAGAAVSRNALNGGAVAYDDVFGGPPRFSGPFAARMGDYSEIFGGLSSSCSIPVLDLPPLLDGDRGSGLDYSEIFGCFDGWEFAVSYEELLARREGADVEVKKADVFSSNGRDPKETHSDQQATEVSETIPNGANSDIASSEKDEFSSISTHSDDGSKQFNMSYHKTSHGNIEDGLSGKTHIAQLHAVPGFTFNVETRPPYSNPRVRNHNPLNTVNHNLNPNEGLNEGISVRKEGIFFSPSSPTNSVNRRNNLETVEKQLFMERPTSEYGPASLKHHSRSSSNHSTSSGEISFPDITYLSVSDISLRTRPLRVPPPSRPPPKFANNQENPKMKIHTHSESDVDGGDLSKPIIDHPKRYDWVASRTHAPQKASRESSSFFDVEVDAGSAAAASAAAMKEAMEQAQARLKSAKESMERKRENFQGRRKLGQREGTRYKEEEEDKSVQEAKDFSKVVTENTPVKSDKKKNDFFSEERENVRRAAKVTPGREEKEKPLVSDEQHRQTFQGNECKLSQSYKLNEKSGAWKTDAQFYELVNNEKKFRLIKEVPDDECGEKIPKKVNMTIKENENERASSELAYAFERNENLFDVNETCEKVENARKPTCHMARMEEETQELPSIIKEAFVQEQIASKLEGIYSFHHQMKNEKLMETQATYVNVEEVNKINASEDAPMCGECENKFESFDDCKLEVHECEEKESKLQTVKVVCGCGDSQELSNVTCQPPKYEEKLQPYNETCMLNGNQLKNPVCLKSQGLCTQDGGEKLETAQRPSQFENFERTRGNASVECCYEETKNTLKGSGFTSEQEESNNLNRTEELYMAVEKTLKHKITQEDDYSEENLEKLKETGSMKRGEDEKIIVEEACMQECYETKASEAKLQGQQNDKQQFVSPFYFELENSEDLIVAEVDHEKNENGNIKEVHVTIDLKEKYKMFDAARDVFQTAVNRDLEDVCQATLSENKDNLLISDKHNTDFCTVVIENTTDIRKKGQRENERRMEKEHEKEQRRKLEEVKEREREREKDKLAVERATREARERAFAEARERAERIAVERVTAVARQRALTESREKAERASAEALEKSLAEKASREARLRAERAAVERATAEARERAVERAVAEKAAADARERAEKLSASSRDKMKKDNEAEEHFRERDKGDGRTRDFPHDVQFQGASSSSSAQRPLGEVESALRCKARLERHQRTSERAAKALSEKNLRDILSQREQAERNRLAESLDADVRRWSSGKEGNLRALLSTLQYILGPESGWHPVPLTEVITAAAVKKAYRKATLCVHPDKLQQRGANIQQKYICEKVFDLLKDAWNRFNSEER